MIHYHKAALFLAFAGLEYHCAPADLVSPDAHPELTNLVALSPSYDNSQDACCECHQHSNKYPSSNKCRSWSCKAGWGTVCWSMDGNCPAFVNATDKTKEKMRELKLDSECCTFQLAGFPAVCNNPVDPTEHLVRGKPAEGGFAYSYGQPKDGQYEKKAELKSFDVWAKKNYLQTIAAQEAVANKVIDDLYWGVSKALSKGGDGKAEEGQYRLAISIRDSMREEASVEKRDGMLKTLPKVPTSE